MALNFTMEPDVRALEKFPQNCLLTVYSYRMPIRLTLARKSCGYGSDLAFTVLTVLFSGDSTNYTASLTSSALNYQYVYLINPNHLSNPMSLSLSIPPIIR